MLSGDRLLFWMLLFSGALLAGWWLAVRPGSSIRKSSATPLALLLLVLTVLLCLLMLSGPSAGRVASGLYHTLLRS